ncbi:hypothetical protein NMY22_g17352 [Coprinellus aureogranulatus]|nr:hypothetical protein NMY22_g17352 [Coprinellus aureogranulatus]
MDLIFKVSLYPADTTLSSPDSGDEVDVEEGSVGRNQGLDLRASNRRVVVGAGGLLDVSRLDVLAGNGLLLLKDPAIAVGNDRGDFDGDLGLGVADSKAASTRARWIQGERIGAKWTR